MKSFALTVPFALILAAGLSHAQSSTETSTSNEVSPSSLGITPCILACVVPAAEQNGCAGFTDIACVCSSSQFQADAGACLQAHCSKTEINSALTLQEVQCGAVSISATGSATSTDSVDFTTPTASAVVTIASSSATSTSPAPAESSETSSNSAYGKGVGWDGIVGALVAVLLAIV